LAQERRRSHGRSAQLVLVANHPPNRVQLTFVQSGRRRRWPPEFQNSRELTSETGAASMVKSSLKIRLPYTPAENKKGEYILD
jgi:hypothetical protein